MTAAYINQLVKGKQSHPRIHYVEALACFFGVPVNYFFDNDVTTRINDQIAAQPRDRNTVTHSRVPRPSRRTLKWRGAVTV